MQVTVVPLDVAGHHARGCKQRVVLNETRGFLRAFTGHETCCEHINRQRQQQPQQKPKAQAIRHRCRLATDNPGL